MSKKSPNNFPLKSVEPLEDLLKNIKIFLKLKEKADTDTYGKDFTVFTALDNELDEKNVHTRFIYEIISPAAIHGMGVVFLEEFFNKVLHVGIPKNIACIEVYREQNFPKGINGNNKAGFIDLYIETHEHAYPIEVKINAKDQPGQIKRYYDYADKKRKKQTTVFYLTLDGHPPSQESQGNISDDNIVCISFKKEIRDWLIKCKDLARRSSNIAGAIHQYITLIEKITDSKENIYMEAIQELISSSPQNYQSALVAADNLPYVRAKMMKRILDDLNLYLTNDERIKKLDKYKTDNDRNIEYYYGIEKGNNLENPVLSFILKKVGKATIEITFEFQRKEGSFRYGISTNGFVGDKSNYDKNALIKAYKDNNWQEYVKAAINNKKGDTPWIWWKSLPSRGKEANFASCNDKNYLKLYEENGYEEFITAIKKEIYANLDNILTEGVPEDMDNIESW